MLRSKVLVAVVAALVLSAYRADPSWAVRCFDDPGDAAQIVAARAAVDSACKCFGVASHGEYTSCARGIVGDRADMALLRNECKGTAAKIYARSVCGKNLQTARKAGPVGPCVSTNTSTGRVRCAVKPQFSCQLAGHTLREACQAAIYCLDAADTNGDLRIAGPGDTGSCAPLGGTFTDNGDGTISDSHAGLMWEKLSDDGSIHDWDDFYLWSGAFAVKIAALNSGGGFAGHTDWRVPTIQELMTLIRPGSTPAVPPELNTACAPGCTVLTCSCSAAPFHWSSTSEAGDPQLAWSVDFTAGYVYSLSKLGALHVRGVRTGP
jgi:hypothetical protein